MGRLIDLTGQRFGRLTVIGISHKTQSGKYYWSCQCDCGTNCIISGNLLKSGQTQSCGCYRREVARARRQKYSDKNNRLYRIWGNMKKRCYCKSDPKYHNYGGRSICICDEWKNSFQNFQAWALSHGYQDDLSIDRIDVNGDYTPQNCRWTNNLIQCNNKTDNVLITYMGRTQTVAEWARETGIYINTIHYRLKHGWTVDEIFSYPPRLGNRLHKSEK